MSQLLPSAKQRSNVVGDMCWLHVCYIVDSLDIESLFLVYGYISSGNTGQVRI